MSQNDAAASGTAIVPEMGPPGSGFTILDTRQARLVEGAVAVFEKPCVTVLVLLEAGRSGRSARGELPAEMDGGTYEVSVRPPDGSAFAVGTFEVQAPETAGACIEPTSGPVGMTFTIFDPQGRMGNADRVIFAMRNDAPALGTPADDFELVSAFEVRGKVPQILDGDKDVTVHESDPEFNGPLFEALRFVVTLS